MVELPLDSSYFTDLDGDGDLDELNITGYFDSGAGMYTKFGIYAEADGIYVSVTLQMYEDGTGQYESGEEVNTITWRYTEDLRVCIMFKEGRNYYITPFTMGGEDYIWLLMEREDCMVWLY